MKKQITLILMPILLLIITSGAKAQGISAESGFSPAVTAGGVYCKSDPVKLKATGSGTQFVWTRYTGSSTSSGTPSTLTETSANLVDNTITAPGYYTYVSSVVSADGCTSDASTPVVVYVLPGITVSIASSSPSTTSYCSNSIPGSLTLTATPGEEQTVSEDFDYNYQWYKGTTAISGATSSTYTLNATNDATQGSQSYTVKVSYKVKSCGEQTSNNIDFTVNAPPSAPTVTIVP